MTAPEHYELAVRLLNPAHGRDYATRADMLAEAQVHATLALAVAIGSMLTEFSEHLQDHHRDDA